MSLKTFTFKELLRQAPWLGRRHRRGNNLLDWWSIFSEAKGPQEPLKLARKSWLRCSGQRYLILDRVEITSEPGERLRGRVYGREKPMGKPPGPVKRVRNVLKRDWRVWLPEQKGCLYDPAKMEMTQRAKAVMAESGWKYDPALLEQYKKEKAERKAERLRNMHLRTHAPEVWEDPPYGPEDVEEWDTGEWDEKTLEGYKEPEPTVSVWKQPPKRRTRRTKHGRR
eukprot:TRINITY_DN1357_c0_g1_i1.p2 TRINITY_DN1357_c0_g1~~TRINITY_DN1357_c0_g1_i1.p2  ORF type:complete len:225 (+),score=62.55 TRINITY_DN1357_c0_g1_i1:73-747(+)